MAGLQDTLGGQDGWQDGYDQYQLIDMGAEHSVGLGMGDLLGGEGFGGYGGHEHTHQHRRGKELHMLEKQPDSLSSSFFEPIHVGGDKTDYNPSALSAQQRNTRKVKKPRSWSDFTTDPTGGDNKSSEMLEQQAMASLHTGPAQAKKARGVSPRAATLSGRQRNARDDMSLSLDAGGGEDDEEESITTGSSGAGGANSSGSFVGVGGGSSTGGSSRSTVLAAKERRRERNKVLARKTRVKKKAELELLRDHVYLLRTENERLKAIVKSRLPTAVGAHLLVECDIQLPDSVAMAVQSVVNKAEVDDDVMYSKLKTAQRSFCISNAHARDHPIVYASPGFQELTGYPIAEILGRNCRFLQGKDTDPVEVARLRHGIENGVEVHATLLNYRKDGTPFWNHVQIAPMADHNGLVTLVIGVLCEVSAPGSGSSRVHQLADSRHNFNQRVTSASAATTTLSISSGSDDGRPTIGGQENSSSDDGIFGGSDGMDNDGLLVSALD